MNTQAIKTRVEELALEARRMARLSGQHEDVIPKIDAALNVIELHIQAIRAEIGNGPSGPRNVTTTLDDIVHVR